MAEQTVAKSKMKCVLLAIWGLKGKWGVLTLQKKNITQK